LYRGGEGDLPRSLLPASFFSFSNALATKSVKVFILKDMVLGERVCGLIIQLSDFVKEVMFNVELM
jgi:hypothetical protein